MGTASLSIRADTDSPDGFRALSRVRDFFRPALPVSRAQAQDDVELPPAPRNRQEALIHAARTALAGTLEW